MVRCFIPSSKKHNVKISFIRKDSHYTSYQNYKVYEGLNMCPPYYHMQNYFKIKQDQEIILLANRCKIIWVLDRLKWERKWRVFWMDRSSIQANTAGKVTSPIRVMKKHRASSLSSIYCFDICFAFFTFQLKDAKVNNFQNSINNINQFMGMVCFHGPFSRQLIKSESAFEIHWQKVILSSNFEKSHLQFNSLKTHTGNNP